MTKLIGLIVCASILLIFIQATPPNEHLQTTVSEGHDFLLEGIDGKKHALDEFIGNGKWVVVNIWATACPFCREELFDLADFHDRHHENDAIVVGLTLDLATFDFPDRKYLTAFTESYLIDYPVLMVSGDIASKIVGKPVNRVPMTLFYNPQGKLVYSVNGMVTEQVLEKVIKNKNTRYHAEWGEKATHVNNPNVE